MDFEEMLGLARTGGDDVPADIFDKLATAYSDLVQGGQESLRQRDDRIQQQEQENLRLKSLAYDTMMSSGDEEQPVETPPDTPQGISSLFTYTTRK